MKVFICLLAIFSVANAGLLNLGGGIRRGPAIGSGPITVVRLIDDGGYHGGANAALPQIPVTIVRVISEPSISPVIHSSNLGGHYHDGNVQIIRVISEGNSGAW